MIKIGDTVKIMDKCRSIYSDSMMDQIYVVTRFMSSEFPPSGTIIECSNGRINVYLPIVLVEVIGE